MAPTGVAAVNINGKIITTALAIPKEMGDNLAAKPDQIKTTPNCTCPIKANNN